MEDELASRLALDHFLSAHGYDVTTATAVDEAIALLDSALSYDVVLLDLDLDGQGGQSVVERLHARPGAPPPWVVGVAGAAGHARIPGVHAVLPKPLHLDELLAVLSDLCGNGPGQPRPPSARLLPSLLEQIEKGRDDAQATMRAAIGKVYQAEGDDEEAAFWFLSAADYAHARGDEKAAATWRTLANLIAPAKSHGRLATRKRR